LPIFIVYLLSSTFSATSHCFERSGEYVFDAAQLGAAHAWCQAEVENALQRGQNVVVSNTFIRRREMNPYLAMAARHNAEVDIHACHGNYESIHNVPAEKMREMRARWEE
jgi:predicted kinase